jgi:general secretion pathway protein A
MNSPLASAGNSHLDVLGLERIPFPTTPDASCYFHTPKLEAELGEAVHCVLSRKGFVLITGEVGLGKSTFVRRLTETVVASGCVVAFVLNTFLRGEELLRAINQDFGIKPGKTFADDVARLNTFLVEQHKRGGTALIIVDDAQNLCVESLELLRMLSNFETSQEKLVQILLAGQPELTENLAEKAIRQLTSRIVKHVQLLPFDLNEAANYVNFRLTSAGASGRIVMAPEALRILHQNSGGNPRRMHLILDRCMYGLVALRTRTISPDLVRRAASESGIQPAISSKNKRPVLFIVGAALALLATVVVASVYNRGADETSVAASAESNSATTQTMPALAAASATATPVTGGVAACLARFGLKNTDGRINGWLQVSELMSLRAAIQQQKPGLTVTALPHGMAIRSNTYNACILESGQARILLWQPAHSLNSFAFGARGKPVMQLQQALARTGQYSYSIDGLAGQHTMIAIADFQRNHGIEATGYPDTLTRFVIEQEAGAISPDSLKQEQF